MEKQIWTLEVHGQKITIEAPDDYNFVDLLEYVIKPLLQSASWSDGVIKEYIKTDEM